MILNLNIQRASASWRENELHVSFDVTPENPVYIIVTSSLGFSDQTLLQKGKDAPYIIFQEEPSE